MALAGRLWVDEATGYDCLIRYNPRVKCWLGYVGVPEGHPWFGKSYDHADVARVRVSGGVTFTDRFTPGELPKDAPAHTLDRWWVGFDRAHFWEDEDPLTAVEQACRDLARQARAAVAEDEKETDHATD